MTSYRCLAVSPEGRTDWRTVEAPSEQVAVAELIAGGFTPVEVRSGPSGWTERLNQPVRLGRVLGLAEQSLILTQLATLVQSGLPVDRSLDLLRDQAARAGQRDVLREVLAKVRGGSGLGAALSATGIFPAYVVGVIRSGEKSGRLGEALGSVAIRMSAAAAARRQLVTVLSYPAAVLAATALALLLVLTMVVPQFEPVFEGEEARLPALTVWVLAMSRLATEHGFLLIAMLAAAPLGLWMLARSAAGQALAQRFRRRIPGMGLRDQYLAGELMALLSTLLGNGVSVIAALPLARDATGSGRWRTHLAEVERLVREGSSLSRALTTSDLVPRTAVRLIEVGERSGQLARTCAEASAILSQSARARIDRILALANPIAIVALGGIVALLVAGVMLGIFAIGDFAG
jgi:type II secretory pathway component PulF